MSYDKQTWQPGDVITAVKMNHMEDGIFNNGYDIVLRLNTVEGDVSSIQPIVFDESAVKAKMQALEPLTSFVYAVEQEFNTVIGYSSTPYYEYSADDPVLRVQAKALGANVYGTFVYDWDGNWFED